MRRTLAYLLMAAIQALPIGRPALAQDPAQPPAQAEPVATEPEMLVTAQRRRERLQDVPLSITVADEFLLDRQQVRTLPELMRIAPSLEIQQAPEQSVGGGGSIRGLGTQSFSAGASSAVGVVVDQVPQGNLNIADLFDVERVEVLKGPQGTLFGLTTSAGVINIVTHAPDPSELSARVGGELSGADVAGSRFGRQRLLGLVNVPLGQDAALRIAGNLNAQQGVDRSVPRDRWDQKLDYGARARLLWEPSDQLSLNLIGELSRRHEDGSDFFVITRATPPTEQLLQSCGIHAEEGQQGYCSDQPMHGDFSLYGVSVQIDYELGPVMLSSISAYRGRTRDTGIPDIFRLAGNPVHISIGPGSGRSDLVTEELRVASLQRGVLEYTAGVFLARSQDVTQPQPFNVTAATPMGMLPVLVRENPRRDSLDTSLAMFGQTTVHITRKLGAIAGARLTLERLALEQRFADAMVPAMTTKSVIDPVNVSWKLGAQYQFERDLGSYATVARGYKGPQISTPDDPTVPPVLVRPEIPMAYELGLKGRVLADALNFDLNAFYIDLSDFQAQACQIGAGRALVCTLTNLSKVNSTGVEANVFGSVLRGLSYNLGLMLNRVVYPDGYRDKDGTDLGGLQVAYAPKVKGAFMLEYSRQLARGVQAFVGADAVYKSRLRLNTSADPYQSYAAHWLTGGRLGARGDDDSWTASLFIRNAFDQNEPVLIYSEHPTPGDYGSIYTPQSFRQVGLSLDLRM